MIASGSQDGTVKLWNTRTGNEIATITILGNSERIVTRSDGRFDTNKPLDRIEGVHWLLPEENLKPLPLELFLRQYYEPGLLRRILKCNEQSNCEKEFKPLPNIAEINRVQPVVYKLRP